MRFAARERHGVPGGLERAPSLEHGHSMLCPYFSVSRFRRDIKGTALASHAPATATTFRSTHSANSSVVRNVSSGRKASSAA